MSDTLTIDDLSTEACGWFERAERPDGESFTRLKDGAPEWITDLVHDAHGDFLPDDWRNDCIRAALGSINDGENDPHEFADGHADVYNDRLYAWLSSNVTRASYVDEAVEEFGYPSDRGISGAIAMGQYMEALEVFESVVRSLEARVDEQS
jgi:hypothetical protein